MLLRIANERGEPSPEFKTMVLDMVMNTLLARRHHPIKGDFFVPAICDRGGRVSYWGVIDFANTPSEDLCLDIERRFFSGSRYVGARNIAGFGLVGLSSVVHRNPFSGLRKKY